MRFASLGSGSKGNGLVVEAGDTRVLVDCGFGPRELAARLGRLNLAPSDLDGILVSHEHGDHMGGVAACARRYALPVWMTYGTCVAGEFEEVKVAIIDSHAPFCIGDLAIEPYPVPHDAREPVQFVLTDPKYRLGVLTDAGWVTPHIAEMLADCDALVLECNHDVAMLAAGRYPPRLKARIAGRFGHLDNDAAAELLARLDHRRLQYLVAAHLSEENNCPELVRSTLARVLAGAAVEIAVADQEAGVSWLELR